MAQAAAAAVAAQQGGKARLQDALKGLQTVEPLLEPHLHLPGIFDSKPLDLMGPEVETKVREIEMVMGMEMEMEMEIERMDILMDIAPIIMDRYIYLYR